MSNVRIFFTVFWLSTSAFSEGWINPANRYLDEYLNHVDATCPIADDDIKHFVYVAADRAAIKNHVLLVHDRFEGAQIMYPWVKLEPKRDQYDFSSIESDLSYLAKHGKKLFIQLQDATFYDQHKGVPKYLMSEEFDGGVIHQYDENGQTQGWVAKRWNKKVRERFAKLLSALGNQFDGRIEGINLQESAIGMSERYDTSFDNASYANALKGNMTALKNAFPTSTTMQYANFMPGEWLPWEDKGYLKGLYDHGEKIGVGLGAPDLMIRRKGQLNHALTMMHEGTFSVPLGIAVQDGNYIGQTGSMDIKAERKNLVPMLHSFAVSFLKLDYMFWVNQQPYFEQDVLTCLIVLR